MTNETKTGNSSLAIVAIVAVIAIFAGVAFFFLGNGADTSAPPAQEIQIDVEAPDMPDVEVPEVSLPDVDLPNAD